MFYKVHKETRTVVCCATNPNNLHYGIAAELGFALVADNYTDKDLPVQCNIGDRIDTDNETVIPVPANYPSEPPPDTFSAGFMREALLEFFAAYEDAGKQLTPKLKAAVDKYNQLNP